MHYTKIVTSEGKNCSGNYNKLYLNKCKRMDFFPYLPNDQIYTKIARSTTYNLVEIIFYLSNDTFWVIVVPLVFNEIKYTPLE